MRDTKEVWLQCYKFFFDKESTKCTIKSTATHTETGINSDRDFENQEVAEKLYKQIIRKSEKP